MCVPLTAGTSCCQTASRGLAATSIALNRLVIILDVCQGLCVTLCVQLLVLQPLLLDGLDSKQRHKQTAGASVRMLKGVADTRC